MNESVKGNGFRVNHTERNNSQKQSAPGLETHVSRRSFVRLAGIAGIAAASAAGLLGACVSERRTGGLPPETPERETEPSETPTMAPEFEQEFADAVYGGRLRIALIDEPPTFDIHQTTTSTTAFVSWHIFEALFTWDDDLRVIPELPETYTVSDDGLVWSITLREGVQFHDGAELTPEDVIASIERWGSISGLGQSLLEHVQEFEIVDERTFEIQLSDAFGTLPVALSRQNQGCAIYPAWVIEESEGDDFQHIIGTGPYRFVEYIPDQHILLERFEVYTPAPGEVDGYGGSKHRFLDQIMFVAVSEEASRVAGLQAGEFHYLESVGTDQVPAIEEDPSVVVELGEPAFYPNLVLNHRSELMKNQHIRRAVQLALDHEPILQAGYGDGFFRLDPSLLMRETPWHSLAGAEHFNAYDLQQADRLLEEAGYDGTALRFMITEAYRDLYNASVVIAQQLEEAGFVVDVERFDWATLSDRRNDPDLWDMYLTLATFRPDPIMRNLTCEAPGWWCDPDKDELLRLVQTEAEFERRYEHWQDVQRLFYEQVPRIKIGDTYIVIARSPDLQNSPELTHLQPAFWNSWLDES